MLNEEELVRDNKVDVPNLNEYVSKVDFAKWKKHCEDLMIATGKYNHEISVLSRIIISVVICTILGAGFFWKVSIEFSKYFNSELVSSNISISFIISIGVVSLISIFSFNNAKEIYLAYKKNSDGSKLMSISIIFALTLVAVVFQFGPKMNISVPKYIIILCSLVVIVTPFVMHRFLKLRTLVDFFDMFIFVLIIGLCWYAKFFSIGWQTIIIISGVLGTLINTIIKKVIALELN